MRLGRLTPVSLLIVLLLPLPLHSRGGSIVSVDHIARGLFPGEVVLLQVRTLPAVTGVQATAFGKTIGFFRDTEAPDLWSGLIGIDLDVKPENHLIRIRATTSTVVESTEYSLVIESKEFPTRHLKVDSKYVDPPKETFDRIKRESKQLRSAYSTSDRSRLWQDPFSRPVDAPANSSFGKRSVLNGKPRSPHSGTDFLAIQGTPVLSPASGRVVLVGDFYFAGKTIVIDHGLGLFSQFMHLSSIQVKVGQEIAPQESLGMVGATGRVTGAHLHWSVKVNGARVDPLSLISVSTSALSGAEGGPRSSSSSNKR